MLAVCPWGGMTAWQMPRFLEYLDMLKQTFP